MGRNPLIERLMERAQEYCETHRISKSTLSQIVCSEPRTLGRVEEGGDVRTGTYLRFMEFFDAVADGADPHEWSKKRKERERGARTQRERRAGAVRSTG